MINLGEVDYFEAKVKRHLSLLLAMVVFYAACLIAMDATGLHWVAMVAAWFFMIVGILGKIQELISDHKAYKETLHEQKRYLHRVVNKIERERRKRL